MGYLRTDSNFTADPSGLLTDDPGQPPPGQPTLRAGTTTWGVVSAGGGSNHYKVRRNESGQWIRIG
jgi:hypothetical protein